MEVHIGCSGWYYDHWLEKFYPKSLKKPMWLEYYTRYFSIVEINSTFYNLPREQTLQRWFESTDENFKFIVKGNKRITHERRLLCVRQEVDTFYSLISKLSYKLKLVLWQFPASFKMSYVNLKLLERFCRHLNELQLKSVFEFRDISWFDRDVLSLLESYGTGYVIADSPEFCKKLCVPATCDTIYIRRHGNNGDCFSSYSDMELQSIAGFIDQNRDNPEINDMYVLFNNDGGCSAVKDAMRLKNFTENWKPTASIVKPAALIV